jgi:hypothetical protein
MSKRPYQISSKSVLYLNHADRAQIGSQTQYVCALCKGRTKKTQMHFIIMTSTLQFTIIWKSVFSPPEVEVGTRPKRGCLLTLAYYAYLRWYEFGERRWNDILTGENRRIRRKTCPSATLSTTNPAWIDPGANPGLSDERPATNDLSHGTAGPDIS